MIKDLVTVQERMERFGESPKPKMYGNCMCGALFYNRHDYEMKTEYVGYQKSRHGGSVLELRECLCKTTLARAI